MKKVRFVFPLMFLAAFAGVAFTRPTANNARFAVTAYYVDTWGMCDEIAIDDDACTLDPNGVPCMVYVPALGHKGQMYQISSGFQCEWPYYSAFSN